MVRRILAPVSVDIDKVAINERPVWGTIAKAGRGRNYALTPAAC
jgi:hypothetical protein